MNLNDIKLTDEMINIALKDALPSARMKYVETKLPFKRILLSKHASERFRERFGDGFRNIDIAKAVGKAIGKGHYTLTYKEIKSFGVDVNFGQATALFQMIKVWDKFNPKEEVYLVKTIYLKMNEFFIERMEHMHDEKIKEDIFEKMIKDQFFKGKTEKEIFGVIKMPSDHVVKKVRKAIHKTHNMVDPISEMQHNNSLLDEVEEKVQYKFGDGVKIAQEPVEKVVYMNNDGYDPFDDILGESEFGLTEAEGRFKFGDGEEYVRETESQGPLGLDLDSSDFPW